MGSFFSRGHSTRPSSARLSTRYTAGYPCVVTFGNRYVEKLCFLEIADKEANFHGPFFGMVKENDIHTSYLYLSECLYPLQEDRMESVLAWCVLRCYDMVLLPRFRHPLLLDHILAMQSMQVKGTHIPFRCVLYPSDYNKEIQSWRRMDIQEPYLHDVVKHELTENYDLSSYLSALQCVWVTLDHTLYCVFTHESVSISKLIQQVSHNEMTHVLIHPRYVLERDVIDSASALETHQKMETGFLARILDWFSFNYFHKEQPATPVSFESPEYPQNDIIPLYYNDAL